MSKLIIISDPRTGTHMLRTALCNAGIEVDSEIFNVRSVVYEDLPTKEIYDRSNAFVVHREYANDELCELISNEKDVKIIFLTRENVLDSFISYQMASKTNVWQLNNGANYFNNLQICFKIDDYVKYRDRNTELIKKFKSIVENKDVLYVTYDEVQQNFDKVLNFLGAEGEFNPQIQKQEKRPMSKVVFNYDEMCLHLKRLGDECFLK